MLGRRTGALTRHAWYVIARDGDLVLRIGPAVQMGRDAAGGPSFEAADARLELDVDDAGTLTLVARPEWRFEAPPGNEPVSRIDVPREAWARLQLDDLILDLNTDFGGERCGEPWQIQCVARVPEAHGVGARPADAQSAALGSAPVEGGLIAVIAEAAEPRAPGTDSPDAQAELGVQHSTSARSARGRHRARLLRLASIGLIAGMIAAVVYVGYHLSAGWSLPVREEVARDDPEFPAPTPMQPEALEALAGVSAMLDAEGLHSESTWLLAMASAKALVEAYPADPRPRQSLEQLVGRLAEEAVARHDRGEAALASRLLEEARAAGVTHDEVARALAYTTTTEAGTRTPAPPIETVMVPPVSRRAAPPASDPTASGQSPQETSAERLAELMAIGEEARSMAAKLTDERDLRAAAVALKRGELMTPAARSAFALYTRVLVSQPESPVARRGLQAVRKGLLDRAREALQRGDLRLALVSLAAATAASADRRQIEELRAETDFQQRLQNARAGIFDRLVHLDELVPVHQEPPRYPRRAPFRAQGWVDLELTVTEAGMVGDLIVLGDPPPYFADAATAAVSQWQFEPMVERGRPIPVRTSVRVTFRRD